jgi:hypothetical protein
MGVEGDMCPTIWTFRQLQVKVNSLSGSKGGGEDDPLIVQVQDATELGWRWRWVTRD